MAPSYSRQLLVFAVPTLAVLLTYFWFKRKRGVKQSDPGEATSGEARAADREVQPVPSSTPTKSIATPSGGDSQALRARSTCGSYGSPYGSPERSPRVLSTPSTPIDIIIPRELRSQRTSPIIISDEDLDIEIEKVKSMRSYSTEHALYKLSGGSDTIDAPSTASTTSTSAPRTPAKKGKGRTQRQEGDAMPAGQLDSQVKPKSPAERKKGKMAASAAKVEETLSNLKLKDTEDTLSNLKLKDTEDTLSNLKLKDTEDTPTGPPQDHEQRQSSERDSANHSPADVMLASPSLSCISDNHSEGSSDSGKGGSDVATPPSRTPAGDNAMPLFYEFALPQLLVGKLIGRYGTFVAEIKEKTHAHIVIKKHPTSNKLKLCVIEGCQSTIEKALSMIRERFPLKQHPEVTLEQVTLPIANVPISTDHLYSKLVEGVNNDTFVSCMVTPGHLFLQQPTHPSYPHLQLLTRYMMMCYSDPEQSPTLPKPILPNTICVAESIGEWCRAMILSTDETDDVSQVTFLDYGGFASLPNAALKQIRGDFLLLPFQAAECYLANIRPAGGETAEWCDEAYQMVAALTKGAPALTQIAEYTESGIPLVLLYILIGPQEVVFLNDELVLRGYAEYVQPVLEAEGGIAA